jgi:hypothetical protein
VSFTANPILSGGTANGVLYLNGSKVATSGSALTFDGTTLATTGKFGITGSGAVPTASALQIGTNAAGSRWLYNVPTGGEHNFTENGTVLSWQNISSLGWLIGGSEQMRLTSTGLGIGTSSPGFRLDVAGNIRALNSGADSQVIVVAPTDSFAPFVRWGVSGIRDSGILGFPAGDDSLVYRSGANSFSTGTERFRITIGGNVGIGTTSPGAKLDVAGSATASGINVSVSNTSTSGQYPSANYLLKTYDGAAVTNVGGLGGTSSTFSYQQISANQVNLTAFRAGGLRISTANSGPIIFAPTTGADPDFATEVMRITPAGNLCIGTTTASNRILYTKGAGVNNEYFSSFENTNSSTPLGLDIFYSAVAPNSTGSQFLDCRDTGATRLQLRSNGGLANYQANNVDLSDARTKKDIIPAASMWGKVSALEIVTYKYNDQTHDDVNLGVIAQQVESVEPVWVENDGFGETPEGEEPLKTVYTKDIYFAAIKALQEAMARIEQLEAKFAALESK